MRLLPHSRYHFCSFTDVLCVSCSKYTPSPDLFSFVNTDCSLQIWDELQQTKCQLESLECERARGIMLRSRAQWVEEGEKNTSYFLRLEKHNYGNKLITKLNVDGKEITDPSEILIAGQNFYATLYKESNINSNPEHICEKIKHFTIDTPLPILEETQLWGYNNGIWTT